MQQRHLSTHQQINPHDSALASHGHRGGSSWAISATAARPGPGVGRPFSAGTAAHGGERGPGGLAKNRWMGAGWCRPTGVLFLIMVTLLAVYAGLLVHFAHHHHQHHQQHALPDEEHHDEKQRVPPPDLVPLPPNLPALSSSSPKQAAVQLPSPPLKKRILQAFLEKAAPDDEWRQQPLPIRSQARAHLLQARSYPQVTSCTKLPQQWPVDDTPAEDDPFLPWIHDVFPTADGQFLQFVAQNKRRCRTGAEDGPILQRMAPQAALFQHVSLQRLVLNQTWPSSSSSTTTTTTTSSNTNSNTTTTRYRLVPHDQADPDAVATRFICRFQPSGEETLSVFNFDYDWTSLRKGYRVSFREDDGGIKHIHLTQLLFRCPVPLHLQDTVRTGASVRNDYATLFVDLIPIRTPPRYGNPAQYLQPRYQEFLDPETEHRFNPQQAWGPHHVLPLIEDAGRWENIPICQPSLMTYENQPPLPDLASPAAPPPKKPHRLVTCIWASAGYSTRGSRFAIHDGNRRLLEWIVYNKMMGFDHFYLYDNSGAFDHNRTLKPVADLFPHEVTYIPWPAQVCNNRPNNVDSPGERSSQYAAESSCLLRFGPHTDWIGQFDIDEYWIPMGNLTNALQLLDKLEAEDKRIVAFASWRAWPRWAFIEPPVRVADRNFCWSPWPCFNLEVPLNYTMLQAYNCDRQKPGQKQETMPAEKQFYRPDYVLQHFVHYSAVTTLSVKNKAEYQAEGFAWYSRGFPDRRQRFGNEVTEGLMIHAKAVARQDTAGWEIVCHRNKTQSPQHENGLCRLGLPWPGGVESAENTSDAQGWLYNCYVNQKVENFCVPRLEERLREFAPFFQQLYQQQLQLPSQSVSTKQ